MGLHKHPHVHAVAVASKLLVKCAEPGRRPLTQDEILAIINQHRRGQANRKPLPASVSQLAQQLAAMLTVQQHLADEGELIAAFTADVSSLMDEAFAE